MMNRSQLVSQLLKEVPSAELQHHRLYIQRHLKQLLTQLSKTAFEDSLATKVDHPQHQKKSYECQLSCYNKHSYQRFDARQVDTLKQCISRCQQPLIDLKKFLDNINYLSKRKFDGCSKKCDQPSSGLPQQQYKQVCLWECYNRLDKRYLKYWLGQKDKLLLRHSDFA